MAKVELYTTTLCPYCWRAKRLLGRKKVEYVEYDLWSQSGLREQMLKRAEGRHTVPQIFIDGQGIGGSDELVALDQSGELDTLLAQANAAA